MSEASLLLLNKTVGTRSTFCVERVRRIVGRKIKVGHSGTLDSTANGLLIVLLGGATRLSDLVMSFPKVYRVRVQLGVETDTDDASGLPTACAAWKAITEEQLDIALTSFLGWHLQVPPSVSAVHVDGERAHKLARSGEKTVLAAKPIFIESIRRTTSISQDGKVDFVVSCGKGTYIRSFARDLGRKVSCYAHVTSLCRESVGDLNVDQAISSEDLFSISREELLKHCFSPTRLSSSILSYTADAFGENRLRNGLPLYLSQMSPLNRTPHSKPGQIIVVGRQCLSLCSIQFSHNPPYVIPKTNVSLEVAPE